MSDPLSGISGGSAGGFNSAAMQAAQAEADAKAQAKLDLARAEADAAALLADLNAADPVHKLPSPYAPGEAPPDPVKGVGEPDGYHNDLYNALDGNFKTVDPNSIRFPTNAQNHSIDFAQKIKDANKYRK